MLSLSLSLLHHHQKTIIRFLQAVFMPIVRTIDTVLKQPAEEADTQATIDKQTLRRCYFQFLQCIAMNDCLEVISQQGMSVYCCEYANVFDMNIHPVILA